MRQSVRRFGPALLIVCAAGLWWLLGDKVPHDQSVRVVLGDEAPRVTEVRLRYFPRGEDQEPAREATFSFAPAQGNPAPRIVSHEFSAPSGEYTIEIELIEGNDRRGVARKAKLEGHAVSVDVGRPSP